MNPMAPYPSMTVLGANLGRVATTHIDHAFRHVLRGPGVVKDRRFVRLISGEPHPFGNFAVVSDPADLAGTEAAIEPLLHCGAPAAAFLMGRVTVGVGERLAQAGFEPHPAMPAMAVDIDSLVPTGLPTGYSFTRVESGRDGDEWAAAFSAGYELPHGVGGFLAPNAAHATTVADAGVQHFAVRKDGRIVCTSFAFLAEGVAGIYCVSTLPEERGKGLGAHVTAEPLRLARKLGYRVGVLQSSPAGYSVYRKLGFTDVGEVPLYVRIPG